MNRLKIATFNLYKNDGDFPNRIEQIPNNLRRNCFDIICFQEDFSSSTFSSGKFLNLELDYNYLTTKTRAKFRGNEYSSSNLTILSKYDMKLEKELFFNKGKEEERACQIVSFDYEGKKAILANTHLCHLSSKTRTNQIKQIIEEMEKFSYDVLFLCGDLNALPSYPELELLREEGFLDVNNEFTHEDKVILDYIFCKSKRKTHIDSKIILKEFSDHYCLLNGFRF